MKRLGKPLMALAVVCTMLGASTEVMAAQRDQVAADGTILISGSESTSMIIPDVKGKYLLKGTATISNPGKGKVAALGTTIATKVIDKVSVAVSVQQYNGSSWTTVANWSATERNTDYVGTTRTYSVPRGKHYRVYTTHTANNEMSVGATNGIYID